MLYFFSHFHLFITLYIVCIIFCGFAFSISLLIPYLFDLLCFLPFIISIFYTFYIIVYNFVVVIFRVIVLWIRFKYICVLAFAIVIFALRNRLPLPIRFANDYEHDNDDVVAFCNGAPVLVCIKRIYMYLSVCMHFVTMYACNYLWITAWFNASSFGCFTLNALRISCYLSSTPFKLYCYCNMYECII